MSQYDSVKRQIAEIRDRLDRIPIYINTELRTIELYDIAQSLATIAEIQNEQITTLDQRTVSSINV